VYVNNDAVTVTYCQFTGNTVSSPSNTVLGGALAVSSDATISASTFTGNTATGAIGITPLVDVLECSFFFLQSRAALCMSRGLRKA